MFLAAISTLVRRSKAIVLIFQASNMIIVHHSTVDVPCQGCFW